MLPDIDPLRPDDVPELSRLLTRGFRVPSDARFAAPDVLAWKYFDDCGAPGTVRSYVARVGGRIVAHAGFCPTAFCLPCDPPREVSTLHIIDWLGSPDHRGVGARLMIRVHQHAETQFGLGTTAAARTVGEAFGYRWIADVPVYQRILRVSARWRDAEGSPMRRALKVARDVARGALHRPRRPSGSMQLHRVAEFGPEVDAILARRMAGAGTRPVFTRRSPALLNHLLRYPEGAVSGWHLVSRGEPCGFALLNIVRRGAVRVGKIVDGFLPGESPADWHAALTALTDALADQGADVIAGYAGTAWLADAYRRSGYFRAHAASFHIRDKQGLIPTDHPFLLTPLEADHAYT